MYSYVLSIHPRRLLIQLQLMRRYSLDHERDVMVQAAVKRSYSLSIHPLIKTFILSFSLLNLHNST